MKFDMEMNFVITLSKEEFVLVTKALTQSLRDTELELHEACALGVKLRNAYEAFLKHKLQAAEHATRKAQDASTEALLNAEKEAVEAAEATKAERDSARVEKDVLCGRIGGL